MVLANFHDIVPNESFLQIQPCQLQELLADPRLESSDEEFVYGAVMRWLGAQTPMPMFADVAELMALIRCFAFDAAGLRKGTSQSERVFQQ